MKKQHVLTPVCLAFLAVVAQGQVGGSTPPNALAGFTIFGTGAFNYNTTFADNSWDTETVGNPCGSNDPSPNGSVNSWHQDWWFPWQPTSTGTFTVDTCATTTTFGTPLTNYDTKIAIWDAAGVTTPPFPAIGPEPLGLVACGDDGPTSICANFSTQVTIVITPQLITDGLWIQLGGWSTNDFGPAVLTITEVTPPVIGTNFCGTSPNDADSVGASLWASGSNSVSANDLVLSAGPVPNEPGIFFYSDAAALNPIGFASFEGRQCVVGGGTGLIRILPPAFGSGNVLTKAIDNTSPVQGAGIVAGSNAYFQCWFRDTGDNNSDGTASGANYSDGYSILFTP